MKILLFLILIFVSNAFAQEVTKSELNSVKSRLDNLELMEYSRIFEISGQAINLFEAFKSETTTDRDAGTTDIERLNLYSTAVHLNFNFNVNDRIKFYSTLGMSKFWNNEGRSGDAEDYWNRSNQGSFGYQGSMARFDKAFFTYTMTEHLSFSIGRMPTNYGPPQHQLDGLERTGTYPRMAYNSIFDGVALSTDASKWLPKDHSLKFRLFFTPYTNVDDSSRTTQRRTPDDTTGKPGPDIQVNSDTLAWAFLTEYEVKNLSWVKSFELHLFTLNYEDFWWESYGDTYRGWGYNATVGLNGIANTGLNFWLSFIGTDWQAKSDNKHINGEGFLFNLNYKFQNTQVLGAEYLVTNKYYYLDEWTYLNIAPFYKTADMKGFHLFYSLPIYDNLRLRVGSYHYKVSESDFYDKQDAQSYYTMLRLAF